jgi:hypothetical protein
VGLDEQLQIVQAAAPYLSSGWARRPRFGETYGAKYIDTYKTYINEMFEAGNKDKGLKKSASQMLAALQFRCTRAHDLPSVSEIQRYIASLCTKNKSCI